MTPHLNPFWDSYFAEPMNKAKIERLARRVCARWRCCAGTTDADDIVQETKVNLLMSPSIPVEEPEAFLCRSLLRRHLDWERGKGRRPSVGSEAEGEAVAASASTDDQTGRPFLRSRIRAAFLQLKRRHQHQLSIYAECLVLARLKMEWSDEGDDRLARQQARAACQRLLAAEGEVLSETSIQNRVSEHIQRIVDILESEHLPAHARGSLPPKQVTQGQVGHAARRGLEWLAAPWDEQRLEPLIRARPAEEREVLGLYYGELRSRAGERVYDASWSLSTELLHEAREAVSFRCGVTADHLVELEGTFLEAIIGSLPWEERQGSSSRLTQLLRRWLLAMPLRSQ